MFRNWQRAIEQIVPNNHASGPSCTPTAAAVQPEEVAGREAQQGPDRHLLGCGPLLMTGLAKIAIGACELVPEFRLRDGAQVVDWVSPARVPRRICSARSRCDPRSTWFWVKSV